VSTWHFGASGCNSLDRELRDKAFERGFWPVGEDSQAPALPRAVPGPEAELFGVVRRIHESAHLVIGAALGLVTKHVNSRRGTACVEWTVPPGPPGMVSFLTALAASKAAQRRWGARALDDHCRDDDFKIDAYARRVTANESDAELLIATVNREAERLVGQYWEQIEWFARTLERLNDDLDHDLLQKILPIVKPARREVIRHRRCFISSDWQRRGLSRPNFDAESREVDAVLSTGMAVRRQDWDGSFDEVLSMAPGHVRIGRLNQGAAVLDSHNWHMGLSAMLGGIVPGSARVANGELTARIKFSRGSELAQRVMNDLQDGLRIPISVGYKVHRSVTDRSTNPETRTATDWEPLEVSLVPVAAEESGTGFRATTAPPRRAA
jgi:hypothetical protein